MSASKPPSPLDGVERAIGFHLRDWWQPTAANYLGLLSKTQIVEALNEAGIAGGASDAERMKKGDAADLAEQRLSGTRWVPAWMCAPDAQKSVSDAENDAPDTESNGSDAENSGFDAQHSVCDANTPHDLSDAA